MEVKYENPRFKRLFENVGGEWTNGPRYGTG